jgi:hypothetical protein
MMPSKKDAGLSTLYFADRPKSVLATGRPNVRGEALLRSP